MRGSNGNSGNTREMFGLANRLLRNELYVSLLRLRGTRVAGHPEIHRTVVVEGEGVRIGRGCRLRRGVFITGPEVVLGDRVFLNDWVYVNHHVSFGDGVSVGQFARFVTGTHDIGPPHQRAQATLTRPISIGAGTWIGAAVVVLPGVTIGPGCVVASGSIVTKDLPANVLAAGLPARIIRTLADNDSSKSRTPSD